MYEDIKWWLKRRPQEAVSSPQSEGTLMTAREMDWRQIKKYYRKHFSIFKTSGKAFFKLLCPFH